jgi:hypothetical protein
VGVDFRPMPHFDIREDKDGTGKIVGWQLIQMPDGWKEGDPRPGIQSTDFRAATKEECLAELKRRTEPPRER